MSKPVWFLLAFSFPVLLSASPSRDAEIASDLKYFKDHTREAMQKIPAKRDSTGRPYRTSVFTADSIRTRDFVLSKDAWRVKKTKGSRYEASGFKDRPEWILDNPHIMARTLEAMEAGSLMEGAVEAQPWSGDYWGFFKGMIGKRFADPSFPQSPDWKVNFDYVSAPGRTFAEIAASGDLLRVNQLSPSEKYDLVTGGALTHGMWEAGRKYYERVGHVEEWMGICDGWASASYMMPRPRQSVDVMAADGKTLVTFYPHDVKALASLLWAWGNMNVKGYLGARCREKAPQMDENGRILDEDCFNTNPGSWHMAIVHQIGFEKKSVAMDATFDYEVWNQPLRGYKYTYFNPRTMVPAGSLTDAAISPKDFVEDKFKKYRSPLTDRIVGIAMDLTYIAEEENPRATPTDSEIQDHLVTVRYYYDLELDVTGKIIGGEWYQNAHPDFLWRPITASRATSNYESWILGAWDMKTPLPSSWQTAAQTAAANDRVPLGHIVEQLVQKASINSSTLPWSLEK